MYKNIWNCKNISLCRVEFPLICYWLKIHNHKVRRKRSWRCSTNFRFFKSTPTKQIISFLDKEKKGNGNNSLTGKKISLKEISRSLFTVWSLRDVIKNISHLNKGPSMAHMDRFSVICHPYAVLRSFLFVIMLWFRIYSNDRDSPFAILASFFHVGANAWQCPQKLE